ncbi:MAG: hypothetical protein JST69_10000 [Bacteroidetes bacterium]|nr:hypothetical protein [Bacteroidota bacterium]
MADKKRKKPHDQITRKLRVGLDSCADKDFHFIFLDIAPNKILSRRESKDKILNSSKGGFHDKYKSAWMFNYYKFGRNKSLKPLRDSLQGIEVKSVESVASNMGWLTWSDLYKIILRGILKEKKISG